MPPIPFNVPQASPGPGLDVLTARQWRDLFRRVDVLWNAQYVSPLYKHQTASAMHMGIRPDLRGRGAGSGAAGTTLSPIVLRAVHRETEPPSLTIRQVHYVDDPPQVGRYEWVGDADHRDIVAYPDFGATLAEYDVLVETADPPTSATKFLKAYRYRGQWLVELPGTGGVEIERFRIFSIDADVMYCIRYDEWPSGPQVTVAKPYLLRRTPFDDLAVHNVRYTYQTNLVRSATDLATNISETQVLIPSLHGGDPVIAARVGVGVTGLTLPAVPAQELPARPVEWLDLNIDARAWASFIVVPPR